MQIKLRYHDVRLENLASNLNALLRLLQNCRIAELQLQNCEKLYETENCRIAFATVAVAELQLQLQQFYETGPRGLFHKIIAIAELQNCAAICIVITQFCNFLFHETVAVAELPSCVCNSCSCRIAKLRDCNFKKVALFRNSAIVAKKFSHHKSWCEKKLQFCNSLEKTQLM